MSIIKYLSIAFMLLSSCTPSISVEAFNSTVSPIIRDTVYVPIIETIHVPLIETVYIPRHDTVYIPRRVDTIHARPKVDTVWYIRNITKTVYEERPFLDNASYYVFKTVGVLIIIVVILSVIGMIVCAVGMLIECIRKKQK